MNQIFQFVYEFGSEERIRVGIMFSAGDYERDQLRKKVEELTSRRLPPDFILLIGTKQGVQSLLNFEEEDKLSIFASLHNLTQVDCVEFNRLGGLFNRKNVLSGANGVEQEIELDNDFIQGIKRRGMTEIFGRRSGMIDAGESAYFVFPSSGRDRGVVARSNFLRASNALAQGEEIYFLAFCLLEYLKDDLKVVYVDTSTIFSVIYAAMHLQHRKEPLYLENFQSYQGLEDYEFVLHDETLAIVSASQSGSMARVISRKGIKKVVTLFQLSESMPNETAVLCNLTKCEDHNPDGYEISKTLTEVELEGRRPLRIVSDQFLVETSPQYSIIPKEVYLPRNKRKIEQITGLEAFSCNRHRLGDDDTRSVWLDFDKLINLSVFDEWLNKKILQHGSVATKAVVYLTADSGSKKVAERVVEKLKHYTSQEVPMFSNEQVSESDEPLAGEPCTVWVVGGAIGHGRRFLEVSQSLRDWAPKSHRVFLVGAALSENMRELNLLKANLTYPEHVLEIMVPICLKRSSLANSWEAERKLLEGLSSLAAEQMKIVSDRIDVLRRQSEGLVDELFWPKVGGDKLSIRDNFAFVQVKDKIQRLTQADIFVIVSTLLQNMRASNNIEADGRLNSDPFLHKVLSPVTFSRFNDGVIQASFLRAADPIELDYRGDAYNSRLMSDIVLDCVASSDKKKGEAATEFVLAIAMKKLRLLPSDLRRVHVALNASPSHEILGIFAGAEAFCVQTQ